MEAQVLVERKVKGLDYTFTYHIPDELLSKVQVGVRVEVPFGKKNIEGFVLEINESKPTSYEIKDIQKVLDETPVLNKEMIELGRYLSKKTMTTLMQCYQTMLPTALKAKIGMEVPKKYQSFIIIKEENPVLTSSKQKEIYEKVKIENEVLKKELLDISSSSLKTLIEKGILEEKKVEMYRLEDSTLKKDISYELSDQQKNAITIIEKSFSTFQPFLLHGVTGSGKTEVYIQLIAKIIAQKKEAILLVPEISLTPQIVQIFKQRFGKKVAILHSGLSNGEKFDEWRKIERGEVFIAIGARSAIFAPFTHLGIIIIDEEHSSTYKQENAPRYHTIDVALFRAQKKQIPVVFGSATPSIESYTRAKMGIYTLIEMKDRINHSLPLIELVDMKKEIQKGNSILSENLRMKIKNCLEKKEQIILLLNRRGYATIVSCKECGYTQKCPNCDIPLTFHKRENSMFCHYCGFKTKKLRKCPECKSEKINEYGLGTERLEQIVRDEFQIPVLRMDVDTTRKKGAHEKIIKQFQEKEASILIGTQMIAKGLDFSNVTLVGVINGDASLNIPDFRSAERTFSLLSQVAGRAGRGDKKGEVIIQGFNIDHYSIQKARLHDYIGFYEEELQIRKTLSYPPYCNLCLIKLSSSNLDLLIRESEKIVFFLRTKLKNMTILGPSMASISKINNIHYMQIIIKYKKLNEIRPILEYLYKKYLENRKIHLEMDNNPIRI